MPNTFAYIMLLAWPFISLYLFKRFDVLMATAITVIAGFMFLPVRTYIDLPALPPFGKQEFIALSCMLGLIITQQKVFFLGAGNKQKVLMVTILAMPLLNVLFNSVPMFNGELWIKGLSFYDGAQQVLTQYLVVFVFIAGVSAVKSAYDLKRLFIILTIAGTVYVPLVLFEIRISPQLHTWLYGFFPHSFEQQFRYDGFRSVAFMGHGLTVSIFLMVCCVASYVLYIDKSGKNKSLFFVCFFLLFITTILNKSLSAVLILLPILLIITLQSGAVYKRGIFLASGLFVLYPMLASLSLIPYDSLVEFVKQFDEQRAQSLDYRFMHEKLIVAHAQEKFFIGWGGWARNRFFDSVTDGYWLIVFSTFGIVVFWALFGLVLHPLFKIAAQKGIKNTLYSLSLGLLLSFLLLDQIPNSSFGHSFLWFLSGCLMGYVFHNKNQAQVYGHLVKV